MSVSPYLPMRIDQLEAKLRRQIARQLSQHWVRADLSGIYDPAEQEQEQLLGELRRALLGCRRRDAEDLSAALLEVEAKAEDLDQLLANTGEWLLDARAFKSAETKAALDALRSGHADVRVSLARWMADLRELEQS